MKTTDGVRLAASSAPTIKTTSPSDQKAIAGSLQGISSTVNLSNGRISQQLVEMRAQRFSESDSLFSRSNGDRLEINFTQ